MIRFFCDLCGREANKPTSQPVFKAHVVPQPKPGASVVPNQVGVRIIRSVRGTWNGGVICNCCLAKSLQSVIDQLLKETK